MPFGLGFFATAGVSAAAGSYELIESTILTGSQASVTFSNLGDYSSTYKQLQIRAVMRVTNAVNGGFASLQLNGDTGANYARHDLIGANSAVTSGASTSQSRIVIGEIPGANDTANVFGVSVVDILDPYATKNKTIRALDGKAGTYLSIGLHSGVWLNTNSLTSITLLEFSGYTFAQYSRFSLYGVK